MPTPYEDFLSQFYTRADRQQNLYDSLAPLGAGLLMAGAPTTNPGGRERGIAQGLLGMQQALRTGENDAVRRFALSSQLATSDLQRQKLQQELDFRQRFANAIGPLFGVSAPAPSGAAPAGGAPAASPGLLSPGASPTTSGADSPRPVAPGATPGPISGPPMSVAPAGGGGASAPATMPSAPSGGLGGGATSGRTLTEQAAALTRAAAMAMPYDLAQGVALLRLAREYDPNVKVEMTAAGELMIRGPDGKFYSAPGVDAAKAQRAGLIAGSEAGARNAQELRFAGPIAAAREQGKNQGAVSLVTVPGVGPLPGTQAIAQTTEAGKQVGGFTPIPTPWGVMPAPQAYETAKNYSGQRIETGRPGFQMTEVPPNTGPAVPAQPRVSMTPNNTFGLALPPGSTPPPAASRVVAQNPNPDPQTGAGKLMAGIGEGAAETLTKSRDTASTAANSLRTYGEAQKLLDAGVITGTGANWRVSLTRALNTIGIGDGINVANTEAFIATMGRVTLDLVKQLGAGTSISNADRDFAEKVAGGNITMSEDGIRKLFDINRRASVEAIQRHNALVEPVLKDPRTDPTTAAYLRVGIPETPATRNNLPTNPADLSKLSDDEVLRRLGVRQ